MELTAVLTPAEEGGYVALNPETGTTTQGETVEEAIANLQEATALYLSVYPRDITARDFIEHTSAAVASLFDAISQEEARYAPIKKALQGAHEMHYADFIMSDLNEDFDDHKVQHKFAQAAEAKMQALLVSQSIEVMCGACLQIAKQGISLILDVNNRHTKGRNIGSQYLSNVIWHGRNQAMHWEEGAPMNAYTQACFKTLSSEFGPQFEIGEQPRNLAWDIWNVIGWSSYEEYEQDMRAILGN